ncbi:unnamed protein product [Effrenium voratum]|nr:unnamed protein product [Effrenium voratum]
MEAAAGNSVDLVGFGKHGGMTYDELWAKEPGYCMWAMTKFRQLVEEGLEQDTAWVEGDSPMKRLALWVTEKERLCEAHGPQYEYNADMDLVEVPNTRSLKERVGEKLKAQKFYGVARPEKRICTSWEECKQYVHGVKGVLYRSFASREEAEALLGH